MSASSGAQGPRWRRVTRGCHHEHDGDRGGGLGPSWTLTDPLVTAITESDRIVVSVDIGVPPGPVWQALTGADCIAGWWGDHVSFDARAGGRLVERWTDAGGRNVVTSGEVVRLTAPRELVLTWADGDWPVRTRVRFVLEEVADGTRAP